MKLCLGDQILRPMRAKVSNLRCLENLGIYALLLAFTRTCFPDENIVDDMSVIEHSTPFFGLGSARFCSFIIKDGSRFGCSTATRTQADQFASANFSGVQLPCQILYHFELTIGDHSPFMCSVVRRCLGDEALPSMPWDL